MKKITLIDNVFDKSELRFLLYTLIDEKINFHKLHRLSEWEHDHNADTSHDDKRIEELSEVRKSISSEMDKMGDKFRVTSYIDIEKL